MKLNMTEGPKKTTIYCEECNGVVDIVRVTGDTCEWFVKKHVCKAGEEKPVNGACLYKKVLVRDNRKDDFLERTFLGFSQKGDCVCQREMADYFEHIYWAECKRIPGYDYGD